MLSSILAISLGASLGAVCRWLLGVALNAIFPLLPPGTLVANWVGSYLIGVASSIFLLLGIPSSSHLYLLVVTGFLGALTTFSTFTFEIGALLRLHDYLMAFFGVGLHVCGSLILFFLGIGTVMLFHE